MRPERHPVFMSLRQLRGDGPLVVAHRGDNRHWPENTLPAFAAAARLGVPMQEFDVRATRDGVLLCLHDDCLDRTTDAAQQLGPGALVAEAESREIAGLDAGRWRGREHAGTRVPTLASALEVMLPHGTPMIEHKAGSPGLYLEALAKQDCVARCILQSFDWDFVAAAKVAAPELAVALLGPSPAFPVLNSAVVAEAQRIGAGMIHWHDRDVHFDEIERVHAAELLLCTYTTDDEVGWFGGAAIGIDAMCTNDPTGMLDLRRSGRLRSGRP